MVRSNFTFQLRHHRIAITTQRLIVKLRFSEYWSGWYVHPPLISPAFFILILIRIAKHCSLPEFIFNSYVAVAVGSCRMHPVENDISFLCLETESSQSPRKLFISAWHSWPRHTWPARPGSSDTSPIGRQFTPRWGPWAWVSQGHHMLVGLKLAKRI